MSFNRSCGVNITLVSNHKVYSYIQNNVINTVLNFEKLKQVNNSLTYLKKNYRQF